MPVANRDIDDLLTAILIYVPAKPCRQLLTDIYRSRAAAHNASLKETVRRLVEALDGRYPEHAPEERKAR